MKSKILFLYKIEYKGFLDCIEWNHFITRFISFLLGNSYVGLKIMTYLIRKKILCETMTLFMSHPMY